MTFTILLLFLTAFIAGLLAFVIPEVKEGKYKLVLVFAGSYLFSVTIIHILPELFVKSAHPGQVGFFILIGFFMQQILEYFTSGAEHGHVHAHEGDHDHKTGSSIMLIIALSAHAFLEGSLLAHPGAIHTHHESNSLLLGILLHKAPAAFALMSILMCQLRRRKIVIIFLLIFSLASPLGLFAGDYYIEHNLLSNNGFIILFAVVAGSFLHISTTIVFESSVDHHFNARKLGVAIFGALIAISAEYWF